ncbi:uncharacterized protein AMSG_05250 [Thecamonas trahens ATCC 50062]|uniref:Ribosomal protein/NADH dehydrogenase domain-containing protein n=1 Tax=Thecamonas trahens ATCC 50062 TaxID=461836 RepID=A0A0L0DAJ1_THETB|nr:hypothetical protein AMSG_05250 [Thecamonas trahens ATCC 50062]KNC49255.1 hypothetical protein AMSG_05250 [Thecamonas trahens ATCC 50062]|eukprot:XP_013757969.1 hypothetical protein AMSG_05250 [Thecamonas trahens ATCC 50062]
MASRAAVAAVADLAKVVREVRFHFCEYSSASEPMRNYVASNYVALKKANPEVPLLVRPAPGVSPHIVLRLPKGVETTIPLADAADPADIADRLTTTIKTI